MTTAAAEFPVSGRIALNAMQQDQKGFNLLVLDVDGVSALEALQADFPDMDPTDSQGQFWIGVTIDPAGKAKVRQAGRTGATKMVVEGVVTIVDIVNNRPQGFMRVTSARPATLHDGGRIIQRSAREPQAAPQPVANVKLRTQG